MALLSGCFSAKQLHQLLSAQSVPANRLAILRHSYERGDIGYLYQHCTALEELLLSRKQLPLTKYHALLAAHQLVLTARYPALALAELYLLPLLADIATCLAHSRRQQDTEDYFVQRGYPSSPGLRRLGHAFVSLAAHIIFLAAALRPYLNVLQSEAQAPSAFALSAARLRAKGVAVPEECAGREATALRVAYLKDLGSLQPQAFSDFVSRAVRGEVGLRQGVGASLRRLLEGGDAFVSIPAINLCVAMLSNIGQHFAQQRHYLLLFSAYLRQADVYAIVVAHNASFLQEIFEEVAAVQGQLGLEAGRHIYPRVDASLQDKLDFYLEFLKCLQLWAACLPNNEIGEVSEVAKYYAYLRDRKFVFPELLLLRKAQADFGSSLEAREWRNDELLRIIEHDEHLLTQCAKWKSSVLQLSLKVEKLSDRLESGGSSGGGSSDARLKFESLLREATLRVEGLIYEENVSENMQHLRSFQKEWSCLRESHRAELPSSLLEEGDALKKKIGSVYPLYLRLKKKSLLFPSFRKRVASILGFQLSDFALDAYDDYEVHHLPLLQSRRSGKGEERGDRTLSEQPKEEHSIDHLECESNIVQRQGQPKAPTALDNPQERQEANEYGMREQVLRSVQELSDSNSELNNPLNRTIEESDHSMILDLSLDIKHPRQENSRRQANSARSSAHSCPGSEGEAQRPSSKMNVYEIYQIQRQSKQAEPVPKLTHSYTLRSRLYLQKIRYSSTRKAIESYAQRTLRSDSSSKTCFSNSKTTSKSIINRQYKRISFQPLKSQAQHQASSRSMLKGMTTYQSFSFNEYSSFFPSESNPKLLKNCLKNKGILHSSEDLEIGFVHLSTEETVQYTLYVTASQEATLTALTVSSQHLAVKSDFREPMKLRKERQEVIRLEVAVTSLPYPLPQVHMKVQVGQGRAQQHSFILPNTFNKYLTASPAGQSLPVSVRTPPFTISKVHNLHSKVSAFFSLQSLRRLERSKKTVCECRFGSSRFAIEILEQSEQKGRIVGHCERQQVEQLQFLLATLSYLLELR